MKLKGALEVAKKEGYSFVAADRGGDIHMYKLTPYIMHDYWDTKGDFKYIGVYSGKKFWKDTMRIVENLNVQNGDEKESNLDEGNGGSTPSQYAIPEGAKDLQDLIEHTEMNWNIANIFKACYRLGKKNTRMYELNKMKWFIDREINLETKRNKLENP